jgi:hypothetical protein
MVESMCRAFLTERGLNPDAIQRDGRPLWLWWRTSVEAALKALHEPTEAMCVAGSREDRALETWQAMIDTALTETREGKT